MAVENDGSGETGGERKGEEIMKGDGEERQAKTERGNTTERERGKLKRSW